MPYSLEFQGGFFDVADFFGRVDGMVHASGGGVEVNGRLLTIDGFELSAGPNGFPDLTASVQATSYLTPHDQGLAGGATPAGPADATTTAAAPATDTSATAGPLRHGDAMKSFEPPKFLANVYRDLRDRHLLIPALGLLAAIVAVPFLLGKSSRSDTSPPPAAVSTEASATQPAVLAASR